jgi:hypothetical protein
MAILEDQLPIFFTIHKWEVITPIGSKTFEEKLLSSLTPFYVMTTRGAEAGWYNPKFPLPAEAIVNRPTENNSTLPWYFLKLENIEESSSSYWLKELHEQEHNWLENTQSLKWTILRLEDDLEYLPLPPHRTINALKIYINSEKFLYSLEQNPIKVKTGKLTCAAHYPKFSKSLPTRTESHIQLERFLRSIYINKLPLQELINSKIYLKFEYSNEGAITSLILNWTKDFNWHEFSMLGLKHENNIIKIGGCTHIVDSDNKFWPIYKVKN